jgi:alcohol dehydrogenase
VSQQTTDGGPLYGKFDIPTMRRVWYGPGCLEHLPEEVERLGGQRVFIVTSHTLATQTDLVDRVRSLLGNKVVGVDAASKQHVPRRAVVEAAAQAREAGADLLISLGGGSQIDCAKAVALCLAEGVKNPEQLDDYRVLFEYPDKVTVPSLKGQAPPHITVGTTLSAGDFTNFAGITDEERRVKDLYVDEQLMPKVSFLDAAITVHTPSWLWASTGMRAVDHCVEAFISQSHMPFTDALAFHALQLLFRYLPPSTRDPHDLAAKTQCQLAAWMSIFGLANVLLGLSHGIGHQLGARCNVPHGLTSCIMLPHVLEFNLPVTAERQALLAQAMGVDTRDMATEDAARAGIESLRRFIQGLGVPYRLRDVNVTREDFDGIVRDAMQDLVVATNPRPATPQDVYALLEKAY